MMKNLAIALCATTVLFSCKSSNTINTDEAGQVIVDYLKANPEFKTTRFDFGQLTFNSGKDAQKLRAYQQLADSGYIQLNRLSAKKKFLAKDSSFVYSATLNHAAKNYVLRQSRNEATVKAILYELSEDKPVDFAKVNDVSAKVTVALKKRNTPFAAFQKKPEEHSEFITRTYRLHYDKESAWHVKK